MGYVRKVRPVKLIFDDEEYAGLEIRMKPMPLGEFLGLYDQVHEIEDDDKSGSFESVIRGTADKLVGWNLENEDGTPVPATFEGLLEQDLVFVRDIISGYKSALFGVDSPLSQDSNSGSQLEEVSIPMEILSESHAS